MKFKKIAAVLLTTAMLASVTVTGCGNAINTQAAAATLDGKDISMGLANFMAQVQAVQMDATFLSYYGEDMWSSDSGDGTTMTESVKDTIMDRIQEYYLMDAHTADYGVELSEEEKTAITDAAAKFLADNNQDALDQMSATQETVEEMFRLYKVQSKMRAAIVEEIDTTVTDEECAQKTFSYVRFHRAEDTGTDTDDGQDQKEEAEAFFKEAADDMEQAAESGEYTIQTCSYGPADLNEDDNTTSMDLEVLKAADTLKDNELADAVVETDTSYYVIRMDATDDKTAAETKKESILSQRREDKYDEVLEGYKDGCEWKINENEWDKVNFDELYTLKQEETAVDDEASGTDNDTTGTDGASGTDNDTTGTDGASGTDNDTTGTDGASGTAEDGATGTEGASETEDGATGTDSAPQAEDGTTGTDNESGTDNDTTGTDGASETQDGAAGTEND